VQLYDSNKCTEQQYFTTQTTCRKPVESVQISYKAADVRNALLGAGQKRHLVITRKNWQACSGNALFCKMTKHSLVQIGITRKLS